VYRKDEVTGMSDGEKTRREHVASETLHIATFGEEDKDAIIAAIRYLPISKLILLTVKGQKEVASRFAGSIGRTLKVETQVYEIAKPLIYNTLIILKNILSDSREHFDDIIMNASSGDKQLGCAAMTAAFINGLKTIVVDEGKPVLLPIIRMRYDEVISEAKLNILRALERVGGSVKDLTELSQLTNYGKPLLSYHIKGSEDSKGLMDLGLVQVSRPRGGSSEIRVTEVGRMLLAGISR